MTYIAGGIIQASDYNSFVASINEIFADSYPGSTIAPPADFGYGHPPLSTVSIGQVVGADEWTTLFSTIKNIGIHQGSILNTSAIPALVNAGDIVEAISALEEVINDAKSSRLSVDISNGQISMIPLISPSYTSPQWTSGIEFTFTVDFGSWNSARHYFNLGGSIGIAGSIPDGAPLSANRFWYNALNAMGVVQMNYTSTSAGGVPTGTMGFYDLTTSYQEIYNAVPGSGYYSGSYISIKARLTAAPGTNGVIEFTVGLYDADAIPNPKTGPLTWSINSFQSSGSIPYLGSVSATTVGGTNGFVLVPFTGGGSPLLTLQISPESLHGSVIGAGTATAGPVTLSVISGTPPYLFNWTNVSNTVTISSPINTPTTSQVSISKFLNIGEAETGTIRCTVTDSLLESSFLNVNWSLTSIGVPTGQQVYTTPGVYNFIVPSGVTSISAVTIGGGGGGGGGIPSPLPYNGIGGAGDGGGGGGLSYVNNIPVTPGETLTITVGAGGAAGQAGISRSATSGGLSSISRISTTLVGATGASGRVGGNVIIGTGFQGGIGGTGESGAGGRNGGGGGGTAGYSGLGGAGGIYNVDSDNGQNAQPGSGGGGGGHNQCGGGGVGLFGIGTTGNGGQQISTTFFGGGGGSGGTNGANGGIAVPTGSNGGAYGGGGGGANSTSVQGYNGGAGGNGAVRIIWGAGRTFPNNAS